MIRPENLFKYAIDTANNEEWPYITIAIDFHGVLINTEKYNKAIDAGANIQQAIEEAIHLTCILPLQRLTLRKDIKLFLYTSTKLDIKILISEAFYNLYGIEFDYIGTKQLNLVDKRSSQDFTEKAYCDVLFDNCAGFDPDEDWESVNDIVNDHYIIPHKHGDS